MSYGDGSIFEIKRPDGKSYSPKRWRICLSYRIEELLADGTKTYRRKKVQRNYTGTKAGARAYRDQLIAERDENGRLYSEIEAEQKALEAAKEELTLTRMIELWDGARRTAGKASERTLADGRRWLRHVEKHLGSTPLKDITAPMVEAAYASIRKERNLSGTSMNHMHTLLKNVFQKAIDYDYIYKNPCAHVEVPKRNDPQRKSLTERQSVSLMAAVDAAEQEAYEEIADKESRREYREKHGIARERNAFRGLHHIGNIMAVRLGLATGMRRGEVFGLIWGNVDLDRRTIRVCQSLTYKDEIKHPKTQAGIRTLAIDLTTVSHLARWKKHQAESLEKIGVSQTENTPVCCSDVGTWYRIDNFEHWWNDWRKSHGFADLKFHELRHTQATQLLANGVDVKTVQTRLGHANASITLGWYAHAIPEKDHEAADLLGSILSGAKLQSDPENEKSMSPQTEVSQMSPECPLDAHLPEETKKASSFKKAC